MCVCVGYSVGVSGIQWVCLCIQCGGACVFSVGVLVFSGYVVVSGELCMGTAH